jgi:outer membrane protein assembly factor BamB
MKTIVANGFVYVGSYDFKLYAINAATGQLNWDFQTGASMSSCPAVAGVFVGLRARP